MMRILSRVVPAVGLIALLAGLTLAQGFRFGGGTIGMLLQNESVQKELKLDDQQIEKVKAAVKEVMDKHGEEFAKLKDLSKEERREKGAELSKTVAAELKTATKDILKPEQSKRLREIELQVMGVEAFKDPEVETALKLTDDQKDKIKTITGDFEKERGTLFKGGKGGKGSKGFNPEIFEKMNTLRKETTEKAVTVLTDEQKQEWKKLTGEPFEVKFEFRGKGKDRGK